MVVCLAVAFLMSRRSVSYPLDFFREIKFNRDPASAGIMLCFFLCVFCFVDLQSFSPNGHFVFCCCFRSFCETVDMLCCTGIYLGGGGMGGVVVRMVAASLGQPSQPSNVCCIAPIYSGCVLWPFLVLHFAGT